MLSPEVKIIELGAMNNQTNPSSRLLKPETEKQPTVLGQTGTNNIAQNITITETIEMRLRQPYIDLIGIWKGFGYPDHRNFQWDSKARIRIWNGNNCHFVVFSDLDEPDSGTSITNSSENLATFIRRDFHLDGTILWFEHYPRHNTPECIRQANHWQEEVSIVTYTWDGQKYLSPRWVYIKREAAETMIDASLEMEGYRSLSSHYFSCPVLI